MAQQQPTVLRLPLAEESVVCVCTLDDSRAATMGHVCCGTKPCEWCIGILRKAPSYSSGSGCALR
jgi:hypothetical protein